MELKNNNYKNKQLYWGRWKVHVKHYHTLVRNVVYYPVRKVEITNQWGGGATRAGSTDRSPEKGRVMVYFPFSTIFGILPLQAKMDSGSVTGNP